MQVVGGLSTNFNYPTYDEASGLFVGGLIYNVTTGTPSQVGSTVQMVNEGNGFYIGTFTPAVGQSYLIVMVVFTDSGYSVINTTRAPGATQIDAYSTNTALLNFNWAAFDQNASLTVSATVYNLTASTSSSVSMSEVIYGVYFGQYQGSVGNQYAVVKIPSNGYVAGGDSFQAANIGSGSTNVIELSQALLYGQNTQWQLRGTSQMIEFTQGDAVVMNLTAVDNNGNAVNITGAEFSTTIKGPNGVYSTFGNSQHAIVNASMGEYTLTLSTTDSANCGLGYGKEIVTQITQTSGAPTYFHGKGILAVLAAVPLQ